MNPLNYERGGQEDKIKIINNALEEAENWTHENSGAGEGGHLRESPEKDTQGEFDSKARE